VLSSLLFVSPLVIELGKKLICTKDNNRSPLTNCIDSRHCKL